MLDLRAPINPGKSAAGFEIGQLFSSIEPLLKQVRNVDYAPGFDLNAALAENKGVLVLRNFGRGGGVGVFFGSDVVRLSFSADRRIGCIWVFDGYQGAYEGVSIGAPLSLLSSVVALEFDDGDEMYYRIDDEGEIIPGLAVVAVEADASAHAATSVDGYCVHDWTVFRTRT